MTTIGINATIERTIDPGDPVFACALDNSGKVLTSLIHHGSEAQARKRLKALVSENLADLRDERENWQRHAIGCTDGTVLLVEYSRGSWGYRMCGPGREYAPSCLSNDDFVQTLDSARKHADSSYGGISWQHTA